MKSPNLPKNFGVNTIFYIYLRQTGEIYMFLISSGLLQPPNLTDVCSQKCAKLQIAFRL